MTSPTRSDDGRAERGNKTMKKYYFVNGDTVETVYLNTNEEAFKEAQRRNKLDRNANWTAYTEQGDVIFCIVVCQ